MPHPQSPLSGKQLASLPKHSLNLDGEPTIPTAAFSPIGHPLPAQTHKNSSPSRPRAAPAFVISLQPTALK